MSSSGPLSPSPPAPSPDVLIVGGGVAGLALAICLRRLHIPCRVFEAYPHLSETAGACLQIAPNGINVLSALGLKDEFVRRGKKCLQFRFCTHRDEHVAEVPIDGDKHFGADAIMAGRYQLHTMLARTLEADGLAIEYGRRLRALEQHADGVTLTFEDGSSATGAIVVGCDGLHSTTRQLLFPAVPKPDFLGYIGLGGVVPLSTLTPEQVALTRIDQGTMTAMRGLVGVWYIAETGPSATGERQLFVWTNFPLPLDMCNKARTEMTPEQICKEILEPLFGDWADPLPTLMRAVCREGLVRQPIQGLGAELPHWSVERTLLIGDAAHATGPAGEGASVALEDAQYLARLLKDVYSVKPGDATVTAPSSAAITAMFAQYDAHRRPRVVAINNESRERCEEKRRVYTPWSAWMHNRMMSVILSVLVWWTGGVIGAEENAYKIPGYDTMFS